MAEFIFCCLLLPSTAFAYFTDSEGACKSYHDFCVDDASVAGAENAADSTRAMRICIHKAAVADNANGQACLADQAKHKRSS